MDNNLKNFYKINSISIKLYSNSIEHCLNLHNAIAKHYYLSFKKVLFDLQQPKHKD